MVDDDDSVESPSPEPQTDSRSALPREIRAWRWLRIVKRDDFFSLIFFSPKHNIWSWSQRGNRGPRGRGRTLGGRRAPPPMWTGGGPPDVDLSSGIFYIFQNNSPLIFRSFRELLFLHKNNTMAILLKTASVRVSFIQIMQVRVQNKGKSVWRSRYDGDVSSAALEGSPGRRNGRRWACPWPCRQVLQQQRRHLGVQ